MYLDSEHITNEMVKMITPTQLENQQSLSYGSMTPQLEVVEETARSR